MKMKKLLIGIGMISFLFASCDKVAERNAKASWMKEGFIDSVQILLTNSYQVNDSYGRGASSFLILGEADTLLCTAKHLLGSDMGIRPEVKPSAFDEALKYWYVFPRNDKITDDSLTIRSIVTQEQNEKDIILLKGDFSKKHHIQPLRPRFTKLVIGEELYLIGCEYRDTDCHQRKYSVIMDSYEGREIVVQPDDELNFSGFSGAPVIDKKGFVVGILSAGGEYEGDTYLFLEPIKSVQEYLTN